VTALITVMSIMNGFQQELRERILGMTAHMTVTQFNQRLANWPELYEQVLSQADVVGAAPNIMEQGMLTYQERVKGVMIRGVLPQMEGQVSDVANNMVLGELADLKPGEFGVVLGFDLAQSLGVSLGESVTLIAPQGSLSPVGVLPRIKRLKVVGLFEAGMYEYDSGMAFMHIEDAAIVFKYAAGEVSALQLKLTDLFLVHRVRSAMADSLEGVFYIRDWTQQHANFFKAIQLEKRMMFIVLALIIMVAAFNIVSTMVMVVTDKQKDIAVLRTLGASPLSIQAIFMIQGVVIGVLGACLGLAGGIVLSLNIDVIIPFVEQLFGFQFFPADVYYISEIPSKLIWSDVWAVSGLAFILTLLATLYPAWRASRVQPAEALRYE
jgi:lipoprotein-releasing system permease protein